jgi:hypothetical protein
VGMSVCETDDDIGVRDAAQTMLPEEGEIPRGVLPVSAPGVTGSE